MCVCVCAQHRCTLDSCKELKLVPSKRLRHLRNLVSVCSVDVHVCRCRQYSRPGRCASYSRAVLACHCILTVSHLSAWRFRSNKLHKLSNKCLGAKRLTKLNKAQQRRPSVRSFQALWLAQHTVPAYRDRMISGSSTSAGLSKTFSKIQVA